jgi:hypothetical protein
MNLICAIGHRTVYSWKETASFLGMTVSQVKNLVRRDHIVKRHSGIYPFTQKDINEFLVAMNAGRIVLGLRGNRRKAS